MSCAADMLRSRAEHLRRLFRSEKDLAIRAMAQQIAETYEQLARNEEWLSGETPPCPGHRINLSRVEHDGLGGQR